MKGVATVATESDLARARAWLSAWVSAPPDARVLSSDAAQALAQAFADERASAEDESRWLAESLGALSIRYRRAVGVVSDLLKLTSEASAVVDDFAAPRAAALSAVPCCGARPCRHPLDHLGEVGSETWCADCGARRIIRPRDDIYEGGGVCALPRNHRGPHGVSGG